MYTIPSSNVIYLDLDGSNTNDGLTPQTAKATLQAAISAVPSGGTVVVRGGVYNQSYSGDMTKTITIQNYPGEEVWFDGTTQITNWTNNGDGTWYCTTPATFSHGADFSGSGDPTRWIDGQTVERAFWPELVFINNVQQQHTEGTVSAGLFKVDYDTDRIYIGTNPSGKTIMVTNLGRLMVVKAPNCRLRGFGIRRYAAAMVTNGGITPVSASAGTIQENLHFTDFPIQATTCSGDGSVIRYCSFSNIGMMAANCNAGTGSSFTNNYVTNINTRMFKGPTPAGVKFARWKDGLVAHNYIHTIYRVYGLWMDVFNDNCTLLNNYVENSGGGLFYEISWRGLLVNNRVKNISNGGNTASYWLLDAHSSELWLNQADRGTAYDFWIGGDNRQGVSGEEPSGISDLRTVDTVICNNVLANTLPITGTWRVLIQNISVAENSLPYLRRFGGNLISTTSAGSSTTSVSRYLSIEESSGATVTVTNNSDAISTWGSQKIGLNTITATQVPTSPTDITPSLIANTAEPLPQKIADLVNVPVGTKAIGPILPAPSARIPAYL